MRLFASRLRRLAACCSTGVALRFSTRTKADVVTSRDVAGVAACIEAGARIVVLLGAGASVSAGIPDFRTPGTGLYDNLERFGLPTPEALFELGYFLENPRPFYEFATELMRSDLYEPTPLHYFLKVLHDRGQLVRCFTQNIDGLETRAGLPPRKVVAAHGNCDTATCLATGAKVDAAAVKAALFAQDPVAAMGALNAEHGGLVKSDIVFFGEPMPAAFFDTLEQDFLDADLLLVAGTSLQVLPFAQLVVLPRPHVPRCLVNLDRVGEGQVFQHMLTGALEPGFDFNANATNPRDVFLQTTTDAAAFDLADRLGWRSDLDALLLSTRRASDDNDNTDDDQKKTPRGGPRDTSIPARRSQSY